MQRVGWSAGWSLATCWVLALGLNASASARTQEFETADAEQGGPRLAVEYGRSPTQVGFALEVAGGVPFTYAQLTVRREGFAERRALVALDEHGAARVVERNATRGVVLQVSCTIPALLGGTVDDAVVHTAVVDLASVPQTPAFVSAGDLVICEIMKDPSFVNDSAGEWIEIRNRSNQVINLNGWKLTDAGSNSHTINSAAGVLVQPKSYFVLGVNADPTQNGGVQVGYKYSNFTLNNGADEIRLTDPTGLLVDVVAYDDGVFWPDDAGMSFGLDRALMDSIANDDGANWCSALSPVNAANTDLGTPRRANNTCP